MQSYTRTTLLPDGRRMSPRISRTLSVLKTRGTGSLDATMT